MLVSDDRTAEWLGKVADKVTQMDVKLFDVDAEPEAWRWVEAGAGAGSR